MIKIKAIEFANFISYGDYMTRVELSALGPTLIVGENAGEEDGSSNGAGKTTIATAIMWCLFGRTTQRDRPADAVVNWNTKKNCYVKIETDDGYAITRHRKSDGPADLIVTKDGADISASTTINAQKQIFQIFGLDYEVFASSLFFGQFGRSFLELSDVKRRAILERIFNLHRINVWADVAKEKANSIEMSQIRTSSELSVKNTELERLKADLLKKEELERAYEGSRAIKISGFSTRKLALQEEVGKISVPNIDKLRKQWELVDQIRNKLIEYQTRLTTKSAELISLRGDISRLTKEKTEWVSKAGTTCPNCKQKIDKQHVDAICQPFSGQEKTINESIGNVDAEVVKIKEIISTTSSKIQELGPKQTVREAEAIARELTRVNEQIGQIDQQIKDALGEENPYGKIIMEVKKNIKEYSEAVIGLTKEENDYNIIIKHLKYIFTAYSDKKKIKSRMMGELIPFLNERITYYLDAFNCEFDLKFDATLQDKTSRWDYEFCSGGERKRIDLAVMFALYDLYVSIYGPQCNVLVLDEVDGRLDPPGVQSFVEVINKDFTWDASRTFTRPDTVLVISHKDEMRDAFPSKIKVVKEAGFSKIVESR